MDAASFSLFRWCFVYWTLPGFQMNEIDTIYVTTGSDVKIKCPNANVNTWKYFESKEVLALCGNGQNRINPNLTAYDRLNVTSDCQLLIQNFTTKDICTYFCYEKKNGSKGYKLHVQLRNLEIDGTDHFGVIQGTEGTNLTLRCTIVGFLPGDKTYWTTDNTLLVSGKTRSLSHTFIARRSYNMKEFTCTTNNSNETQPLITHVKLNLLLKPSVLITVSNSSSVRTTEQDITVRQGQDMKLQCQEKHNENRNGEIHVYAWFFNRNVYEKNTNVITFNKIKSERSGKYTCLARNKAGNDSDTVNIIVTYPPIVWTKDITFNEINRRRIIKCKVLGEPNIYNITWRHYTNNNQLVRMFNNSRLGVLILPEGYTNDLVYEDSGVYICNVTNGIPDESGNLWQSEKIKVMVEGKPVLAKPLKSTFIGHINETSSMSLFVLSSSNVTRAEWKAQNRNPNGYGYCSSTVNKTSFHGKLLDVSGYTCVFIIQNTRKEDFQNYTVDFINKNGRNAFNISLISAGAPGVPTITDVYQRQNYIVLEWRPNFDGGAPQGFIIQYRKQGDEIWESIWIQSNETNDFVHISDLKPNTEYKLRILAFNRLGNSSFTVQYTTIFKNRPEMPTHVQVLTLDENIIVKWKPGKSDGMLQTFFIQFRKRFEFEWSVIPADGETFVIIDGLQAETVYFVRVFTMTIVGESNKTDKIMVQTGSRPSVFHKFLWKISFISSVAFVGFLLCLYGIKALGKKIFCLNAEQTRNNTSQVNETAQGTLEGHYDEIDSVYYNATNGNNNAGLTLSNILLETPISSNNHNNVVNIATNNDNHRSNNEQGISLSGTAINISETDNASAGSSSDNSYLVPCHNYTNLEIGVTGECRDSTRVLEYLTDSSSASINENSETQIKSDHQYETLAATNVDVHSYAIPVETY